MNNLRLFSLIFFTSSFINTNLFAQNFSFSPFPVSVSVNGNYLSNPWSGSYNSGQFWPCDINNDGQNDLLVYDKTSERVLTFLARVENGNLVWRYNPDFEDFIPPMEAWMASADFNCDGKLDLFTQTTLGIKVYKNISLIPGQAAFALEIDGLTSQGLSGQINVQVNVYGAPSFLDVDNDGDLDILNFDFSGNTVEFHKNLILENTGNCAGFQLKKDTCVFGRFATKPICGQIKLNTSCFGAKPGGSPGIPTDNLARIQHLGSQLCALDLDNDGDKDLLVGDLGCPLLNRLVNGGTLSKALITNADTLFPNVSNYVKLNFFPSAYHLDMDFDGIKDLMVSPTYFSNVSENYLIDGKNASHFYKNNNAGAPDFQWIGKDYFQNQGLDAGEESTPAFADADGDGDQDLWIGNLGNTQGNLVVGKIAFYRNIGTTLQPNFTWETDDYLSLSTLSRKRMRPIFQDFNGDGALDFAWISAQGTISPSIPDSTRLFVLLNQNAAGQALSFPPVSQAIRYPFAFDLYDSPVWVDVNGDNMKDMLVGKYQSGRIQYWRVSGTWPNLQFSLQNGNYGNVARYPLASNANLALADVDQNGNLDLVVGDFTGNCKWFPNFLQSSGNTFLADSSWYFNQMTNQRTYRKWGLFVSPALADLNGDGFPEMAFGTLGGGIILMVNRLGPNAISDLKQEKTWAIFPNPVLNGDELKWTGPLPDKIHLYSNLGKEIMIWEEDEIFQNKKLKINHLSRGIYILSFQNSNQIQSFTLSVQ
jgi:hypothetical protein